MMSAWLTRGDPAAVAFLIVVLLLGGGGGGGRRPAAVFVRGEAGTLVTLFRYYPARQAAFGANVPEFGELNLMLPPRNQSNLCEYSTEAQKVVKEGTRNSTNVTAEDELPQNAGNVDLAILVRTGTCTAQQQAQNAVRIRNEAGVSLLRYLIIEGEPSDGSLLGVLFPDTNETEEIDSTLVVLGMPYRAGVYLRDDIRAREEEAEEQAASSGTGLSAPSPYLFDNSSVDWDMIGDIDLYVPNRDSSMSDNFYWFRVLLFTLLIVSPCIRAAYLWWVGGGRLRLRRNEQGRIVGLQYIRPIPYWLSSGMIPGMRSSDTTTVDVLTEEEFRALPEIEYKPRDDTEARDDNTDVESGDAPPVHPGRVESSPAPAAASAAPGDGTDTTENGGNDDVGDHGARESTCTMCSICIDDFEEGEKLVLLPRCRHSFHHDCLHPWLTGRQGCCPLCKTSVLEKDENRTLAVSRDEDGSSSYSSSDSSDSRSSSRDTALAHHWRRDDVSTAATSTNNELDDSEGSLERTAGDETRPNLESRTP